MKLAGLTVGPLQENCFLVGAAPRCAVVDPGAESDRIFREIERLGLAPEKILLTPGHVSNHVCFLVEEDRLLMTGDHMMAGSTVVIVPPAGDMRAYIASLERMLAYPIDVVAPGHGDLIDDPQAEIRRLVAHRLQRERKVVDALAGRGPSTIAALLAPVYDDVDPALHQWAALSLHAHLLKLAAEGRAEQRGETWHLCG